MASPESFSEIWPLDFDPTVVRVWEYYAWEERAAGPARAGELDWAEWDSAQTLFEIFF